MGLPLGLTIDIYNFLMTIAQDGYRVHRGVIAPSDVAVLRDVLDRAFAAHPVNEVNRWVHVEPLQMPELRAVMRKLLQLAGLGPLGVVCPSSSFLKRIEPHEYARAKIGWHRDADAADTARLGHCLNIWVPLDDVGIDAPSLQFVRGSHKAMRARPCTYSGRGDFEIPDDGVSFVAEHFPDAEVDTPLLAVGDAVVFDHHLLHRTQLMTGEVLARRSLECRVTRGVRAALRQLLHQS